MVSKVLTASLLCFILAIVLIIYGANQIYKNRTYVVDLCQVIDSSTYSTSCSSRYRYSICYKPVWTVTYGPTNGNVDGSNEKQEAIITTILSYQTITSAFQKQRQYLVGGNYTCYHSRTKDKAQWPRPSQPLGIAALIIGICLLLLSICPVAYLGCRQIFNKQPNKQIDVEKQTFNPEKQDDQEKQRLIPKKQESEEKRENEEKERFNLQQQGIINESIINPSSSENPK